MTQETLSARVYGGLPAVEYFVDAYTVRSKLAHGDEDRPPYDQLEQKLIDLRRFVGDLLNCPMLGFEA